MSDDLEQRLALALDVAARIARLAADGRDEIHVIYAVVDGLERGFLTYGPLDVDSGRDWELAAAEEMVDRTVYKTAALVSRRRAAARPARSVYTTPEQRFDLSETETIAETFGEVAADVRDSDGEP